MHVRSYGRLRMSLTESDEGGHRRARPEEESRAKRSGARDYPKIELHVHLEGTVRAHTLLEIAKRNDYALPADTVEGLQELYRFTDFRHFIEVWILTTNALKKEADYRQMVVDYAKEAAAHGAGISKASSAPPSACVTAARGRTCSTAS